MSGMRALVKAEPKEGLKFVRDYPVPSLEPNEVLVKVEAVSVCGTDVHIYRWDKWSQEHVRPPRVLGHEVTGYIEEVGSGVRGLSKGDRVSLESHIVCGQCYLCRTGNAHLCQNMKILGIDVDGGYAEYVKVPAENAFRIPSNIKPEVAAMLEPFGNAVHVAFIDDFSNMNVVVMGAGPIGSFTVGVLKAIGARVAVVEPNRFRQELVERMNPDRILSPEDPVDKAFDRIDAVLEMSGSPYALRQGISILRPGGILVLFGIPSEPVTIDTSELIFKGIKVYSVLGRKLFDSWYKAIDIITSGLDISVLVTHRLPLEDYRKGFEDIIAGKAGKVVFFPNS